MIANNEARATAGERRAQLDESAAGLFLRKAHKQQHVAFSALFNTPLPMSGPLIGGRFFAAVVERGVNPTCRNVQTTSAERLPPMRMTGLARGIAPQDLISSKYTLRALFPQLEEQQRALLFQAQNSFNSNQRTSNKILQSKNPAPRPEF
jgi:hypothetical protein